MPGWPAPRRSSWSTDLRTLETVLLVHDLRPGVRVVAHLDNPSVARAVEEISGVATVLDVATLFAPSVIEACVNVALMTSSWGRPIS